MRAGLLLGHFNFLRLHMAQSSPFISNGLRTSPLPGPWSRPLGRAGAGYLVDTVGFGVSTTSKWRDLNYLTRFARP
ncbi:hypothetical protein FPV67DRAFT_1505723 [Lyophyllum atratum]|nr:hypothetical protein FPV67DRAFT_1505723 [Lyophyllum atratum]